MLTLLLGIVLLLISALLSVWAIFMALQAVAMLFSKDFGECAMFLVFALILAGAAYLVSIPTHPYVIAASAPLQSWWQNIQSQVH